MAKEEMMIVSEGEKHLAEGVTLCIPPGVTLLNFFLFLGASYRRPGHAWKQQALSRPTGSQR